MFISIGSGNGLVPAATKPLPEPMLNNNEQDGNENIQTNDSFGAKCFGISIT